MKKNLDSSKNTHYDKLYNLEGLTYMTTLFGLPAPENQKEYCFLCIDRGEECCPCDFYINLSDDEQNSCEYCPNSHVRRCEDGTCIAECGLPEDVNPEDVLGSRCVNNND